MIAILSSCKKSKNEPPAEAMYAVTFNSNGGSSVTQQSIQSSSKATKPTDPTRTSYTFTGWYATGSTTVFDFNTPITANITLTAMWMPATSEAAMDEFLKTARFMPNDPRTMTADDKAWFSQNAAWDFTFIFKPEGFTLTTKQENQLRVYFEGVLKTFNYMVYTKPVALATKAMFADRAFFYDKTNAVDPDPLPSAVGTLLVLRGLNTEVIKNKVFTVTLQKRGGNYTGAIFPVPFNPDRDKYTAQDLAAGRRLNYRLPADPVNPAYMTLPVGENFELLKDYDDYWMYTSQQLNDQYTADPNHAFSRGFNYDLLVHELLHAMLNWNHAGGGDDTDLVYSYSGMIGLLMDQRGEERKILTETKILPTGNDSPKNSQDYIAEFGGHMPMACYAKSPFSLGFRRGTYNLYSMYMQNQLNVPVYLQPLPPGTIFYNNTTGPNAGDQKGVPPNPFDGITWKLKYSGVQ